MQPRHETSALDAFRSSERVRLFHGTTSENANRLLSKGKVGRAPLGANQGRPDLLYVTTNPENATWFAQQAGGGVVLEVDVPRCQLRTDPEDGVHPTVLAELVAAERTGIPASLAVFDDLPALRFRRLGVGQSVDPMQTFLAKRFGDSIAPDGSSQAENFSRWFGPSKCRDESGVPAVLYHGTITWARGDGRSLGDIEAFDRLASVRRVRRPPSIDTVGSWFSSSPGEQGAGMYAYDGVIYPVYLAIQNPWETTFASMLKRARDLAGLQKDESINEAAVNALRSWLKDAGRDGIRITHDAASESTEFQGQTAWIALEPSQIKSSLGNAGSYDPADPGLSDPIARAASAALMASKDGIDPRRDAIIARGLAARSVAIGAQIELPGMAL